MKHLLEEGLQAGAIGLSLGLMYAPGSYTSREELEELCSVLPKYGGLLATHIRGEGNSLIPSIEEVIWIAERNDVPLQISHLKAAGRSNWGSITRAMELVEEARSRGLDVACDVYPYTAGSTSLTTLLPPWALEGGISRTLEKLRDLDSRKRIREELRHEQEGRGDKRIAERRPDKFHDGPASPAKGEGFDSLLSYGGRRRRTGAEVG